MDSRQVDPGSGCNVAQLNGFVALFAKQPLGGIQDLEPCFTHSNDLIIRMIHRFVNGEKWCEQKTL